MFVIIDYLISALYCMYDLLVINSMVLRFVYRCISGVVFFLCILLFPRIYDSAEELCISMIY